MPTGAVAHDRTVAAPNGHRRADAKAQERPSISGAALSELLGTFLLLLFGVGAILAVPGAETAADRLAIGLGFGLALLVAAYALGHISGAHLNPAVTIGLWASRRFPASAVGPYVAAQLVGAVLAVALLDLLFEPRVSTSVTHPGPGIGVGEALVAEFVLGFFLMLVVKGTAVDDRAEGPAAGLAIGLVVAAGHLAFIPISGASFNPARSFGSAVVAGDLTDFWLYVVGPVLGAVAAALLHERVLRHVRPPEIGDTAR